MPDFEIRNVNISDDAAAAPGRPMWGYIQLTHYTEDAFSTALKNIINAFKKRMFFLSYLRVFLYWPLQDGWGGGAGAGMQSDAQGDRNMKRSFHWFPIKKKQLMAVNTFWYPSKAHLFSLGSGFCTWCCSSCWPLSTLDFFIYRSDGSQKAAPRLSSPPNPGQTAGGRCWADRCKPLLLLHSSASHTAELSTSRGPPHTHSMPGGG